jgi:hypothetical protein
MRKRTLLALLASCAVACAQREAPATNRVVLVLDASGSFAGRQAEAIARASRLLESIASRKLRRWEKAEDHVSLISLDAAPAVIWQGSLRELKQADPATWKERFAGRSDYARCTDVTGAFQLAAQELQGDAANVSRYLFAFTDLRHEPPTRTVSTCSAAHRGPAEDFPWELLGDSSVSVFWVPPDPALEWRRAVQERGFSGSFHVYTASESGSVQTPAPPPARSRKTAQERDSERDALLSSGVRVAGWAGGGLLGLVGVLLLLGQVARRSARRRPARRAAARELSLQGRR